MEIKKENELRYYRIRSEESFYTARETIPNFFNVSSYNKNGNNILEIADFCKTQYFKNVSPYYKEFNQEFYKTNPSIS